RSGSRQLRTVATGQWRSATMRTCCIINQAQPRYTIGGGASMSKVSVRYIVADVDAAIPFYTRMLGFQVDLHPGPGFARLSKGDLFLLLNRPGAGGAGQDM